MLCSKVFGQLDLLIYIRQYVNKQFVQYVVFKFISLTVTFLSNRKPVLMAVSKKNSAIMLLKKLCIGAKYVLYNKSVSYLCALKRSLEQCSVSALQYGHTYTMVYKPVQDCLNKANKVKP